MSRFQIHINDRFAQFSEALYVADRHAREEVRQRSLMQQKIAQKEKEAKEENLRLMAQRAREERSGVVIQPAAAKVGGSMGGAIAGYGSDSDSDGSAPSSRGGSATPKGKAPAAGAASGGHSSDEDESDDEADGETEEDRAAAKERAIARQERRKERERELRMNNMGTEQRAKVLARSVSKALSRQMTIADALGLD